jgi:hypothetical protein
MRMSFKAALAAVAIVTGASLAAGVPAKADNLSVQVQPGGGVAFGYNDGYWDQGHQWHGWKNTQEQTQFRQANNTHFYAWKHDRDSDKGWRANDSWWDHK